MADGSLYTLIRVRLMRPNFKILVSQINEQRIVGCVVVVVVVVVIVAVRVGWGEGEWGL